MSFGSGPYGGGAAPPLSSGTLTMVGFVDERFGSPTLSGIYPPGFVDEQFGSPTLADTGGVNPPGFVDELFGGTILGGGASSIAPPGFLDEGCGVPWLYADVLTVFYGPLPTPTVIAAPYSNYYGPPPTPPELPPSVIDGAIGGSRYRFVITDMRGNVQGEVRQASQKTITQVLDNMCTAAFTVKVSNSMADYILNNPCLCKCYRRPINPDFSYQLLLTGDVTTDEEDTSDETGTITFTVADPLNRLMYRLLGKGVDANNHGVGFVSGTPTEPKDVADTIGDMLLNVNSDSVFGSCGVTLGIRGPHTPTTYIDKVFFTPVATQLALYTNTLDGVDFLLEPQEPYSYAHYPGIPGTNPYITGGPARGTPPQSVVKGASVKDTILAKLNVYFPMGNFLQSEGPPGIYSKGRPYAVFEYGTGKRNVQGYQRIRNRAAMSNRWWSLPDGWPASNSAIDKLVSSQGSTPTPEGNVSGSIAKYGGYESVDTGDLGTSAQNLRQLLVNAEASTTAVPQQQITFTPTINCDEDWTVSYSLGDVAIVRAYVPEANDGQGSWRFNGTMRIYGISGTIDDNEQEQIQITTIHS